MPNTVVGPDYPVLIKDMKPGQLGKSRDTYIMKTDVEEYVDLHNGVIHSCCKTKAVPVDTVTIKSEEKYDH